MNLFRSPIRVLTTALLLLCMPMSVSATVDESHDYAMEAADAFVKEGFIVREEYWNGEVKGGQKLMISHQFFKGNEYALWLGTALDDVTMDLKVFDEKGTEVQMDTKVTKHFLTVRVNPPKTGTYKVVFEMKSKTEGEPVLWALAYGYR
ncbi:MAG: hypothetical protein IPK32_01315 [Verrucomicrobiaceae bacterium]|nr:hypothetical protein [Verrucomicrobiaceae bacterium]